jgi:hypothetical protein
LAVFDNCKAGALRLTRRSLETTPSGAYFEEKNYRKGEEVKKKERERKKTKPEQSKKRY